ncbi:MAG TPA: SDR family oxidoreductase [Burkholderiales bacterium]|nr:SDR family oxidoreductase [Burkholderiales bacterium]
MKVLITGGTGLLALNWACAVRDTHEVVLATHRRKVTLARTTATALPLDDRHALAKALQALRPDVVVHTAGITSVEECERDEALARHVYVDLSRNVAEAANVLGAAFVYISTDHLFRGTRAMHTEDAPPQPVNAYGRVKLLSEAAVAEAHRDALILRTNFFGWGHRYRRSFSDWIYYSLLEGRTITMFDDVFVTPLHADRLALAAHRLLDSRANGIYNVVGDERVSKYDFAVRLAEAFGLPKALVQRGKIAASKLFVTRPPDMSLDNRKARERLGTSLGELAEHLRLLRQQCADRRGELLAAVTE